MVFVLEEVPRDILQCARHILADPLLGHAALRTPPLRFRHLVVVNLAREGSGPEAVALALPWTLLGRPGLLGLPDLLIQGGVLPGLGLGIDRRRRVCLARLAAQRLEEQLQLPGIDALRSLPHSLPPQLRYQQFQFPGFVEHRLQGGKEKVERLLHLAFAQQGLRRLPNLLKRRRLQGRCPLGAGGSLGRFPRSAHRHHPRDLRRSRSRNASRLLWLSSSIASRIRPQASTASLTSPSWLRGTYRDRDRPFPSR